MGRHKGTQILANTYWGSPRSSTAPQNRYSEFCELGTWAGTQADWFLKIHIEAPQDQAQCHNLDLVEFVKGAQGQAHRNIGFCQIHIRAP